MSRHKERQPERYHPPFAETKDGKFIHEIKVVMFRGVQYPSTFVFEVGEDEKLRDGQRIGHTLDNAVLYWSKRTGVITRG
jgi:hypothetical protein